MRKFLVLFAAAVLLAGSAAADWQPADGHKMHFPQLPDLEGWDVNTEEPVMIADDWMCSETGPVSEIHFWGSYDDNLQGRIDFFILRIYADIPADPPQVPFSRPGLLLWERTFQDGEWVQICFDTGIWEGWYDPESGTFNPQDHTVHCIYNFTNIQDPFIQTEGVIYWLGIKAIMSDPQATSWGWKTSLDYWNDNAVWALEDPNPTWDILWDPENTQLPLHMAFVINHFDPVPTLSEWGILALVALILGAGAIVVIRRRRLVTI